MQLTLGYPHLQDPKLQRLNHLHRSILTTAHHRVVLKTSICQGKVISMSNLSSISFNLALMLKIE